LMNPRYLAGVPEWRECSENKSLNARDGVSPKLNKRSPKM